MAPVLSASLKQCTHSYIHEVTYCFTNCVEITASFWKGIAPKPTFAVICNSKHLYEEVGNVCHPPSKGCMWGKEMSPGSHSRCGHKAKDQKIFWLAYPGTNCPWDKPTVFSAMRAQPAVSVQSRPNLLPRSGTCHATETGLLPVTPTPSWN